MNQKFFGLFFIMIIMSACVESPTQLVFSNNSNKDTARDPASESQSHEFSVDLQIADRSYVESVLRQVFDAPDSTSDIIYTDIYQKIEFGGACDQYSPSDIAANKVEFPKEVCTNGIGVVQVSNNNPMRYSITTKVCEKLVADSNRMGAVKTKIFGTSAWSDPTDATVLKAYELFYQVGAPTSDVISGLKDIRQSSSSAEEAWKGIVLTLCISPGWQVL